VKNVELKARIDNVTHIVEIVKQIGATLCWEHSQRDTYFTVPADKLKLRQETGKNFSKSELIAYKRAHQSSEKVSHYRIYNPSAPEQLIHTLGHILPIDLVVDKVRTLYMWKNVRIHIDQVDQLGDFIEFEAVVSDECDQAECEKRVQHLADVLKIRDEQLIACGYYDLMKNKVVE